MIGFLENRLSGLMRLRGRLAARGVASFRDEGRCLAPFLFCIVREARTRVVADVVNRAEGGGD